MTNEIRAAFTQLSDDYTLVAKAIVFLDHNASQQPELAEVARALRGDDAAGKEPEWPVGTVIASAMQAGLAVDSVHFANGAFLDIGVPKGASGNNIYS